MSENDFIITPDWPVPAAIRAAVTTRCMPGISRAPFDAFNLGTRCGDDASAVAANRSALISALPLPSAPRWLHQVHGTDVSDADAPSGFAVERPADAAVARTSDTVLAVLTADCLPILFAVDDGSAIAAAHAGWRGLAGGVIEATIARLGMPAARLHVWLGPAIAARSYEVGTEVRAAFLETDTGAASAFEVTRAGHWRCDLYALARRRLTGAGVSSIHGGDLDTFGDPRFYSYRRERITGRFATLIWRVSPDRGALP